MTRFRPISAAALLLTASLISQAGATQPAVAAPASAPSDVTQLTTTLPTLNPGQTAWVSTLWQGACVNATSFQMTASGTAGISISYPTNTGSYSSLYKESTLLADDTDYASLKISVGDSVLGNQTIALTVSYQLAAAATGNGNGSTSSGTDNGKGNLGTNNGNHNGSSGKGCTPAGTSMSRNLQVTLPVAAFNGPAVQQVTTSVGPVPAGTAEPVSVYYKANKPGVTSCRLTVTPPAGATVTYPNHGTFSGFSQDADLSVGETDYAGFTINTASLQPGSYPLGLVLTYGGGTQLPGSVTLVVS